MVCFTKQTLIQFITLNGEPFKFKQTALYTLKLLLYMFISKPQPTINH